MATGTLTILLISALMWGIGSLLTRKNRGEALWDRRAAITSVLLSSLVLAPVIGTLLNSNNMNTLYLLLDFAGEADQQALSSLWLFIPAAVAAVALCVGLAMMLMRPPREGKDRCMPVWSLLLIYASTLGSLAYIAYGFVDFRQSSEFFATIAPFATAMTILIPSVALLLYALLRAEQFRSGRVHASPVLTFAATLRYGSALVVCVFAVAYLALVGLTAHLGVRADAFARNQFKHEAAIVQKSFK
jgi:hypothetical protein